MREGVLDIPPVPPAAEAVDAAGSEPQLSVNERVSVAVIRAAARMPKAIAGNARRTRFDPTNTSVELRLHFSHGTSQNTRS